MRDRSCWSNIPAGPCRRIGTRGSRWSCGLAGRNVLPKYGFPVDVVGLNVVQTGSTAENEIDLTRDLSLAIVDYAPGHSVVAAKKLWTSKGINIPRDRAAFTFAWAKCECGDISKVADRNVKESYSCSGHNFAFAKLSFCSMLGDQSRCSSLSAHCFISRAVHPLVL